MEARRITSHRLLNTRRIQNFVLVWLDENIDNNYIAKLRQIVNSINTFIDVDECMNFMNRIKDQKIFIIISDFFGETIVPVVHDQLQVNSIYIFSKDETQNQTWMQQWSKIKGVFKDIAWLCEDLKKAAYICDKNSVSINLVKTNDGIVNQNLNELDQSFMHTQILKDILLSIDFEQCHIHEFLTYWREQFSNNRFELENIDRFEKEDRCRQPIWWYTKNYFLYSTINYALRTMQVDLIVKMGFFVQDLHHQITKLHSEQNHCNLFTVYRGQGLLPTNFEEVMKTKGGLLSFNNFLSTSTNRQVSFTFAESNAFSLDLIGVLFQITIDSSISSTPFADVHDVSAHETEEEILFSMHCVFRIGEIKQIDGNDRLWQVDLILTDDKDPQLYPLIERMREEIKGSTGWFRLGRLMIKLAQYNEAEDLYKTLLAKTTDEREKADIFYQLACIKHYQEKHREAITLFENVLQIRQEILTSQHPDVADCYNDIGVVHERLGEYSEALSHHEKAHQIYEKTLPENHPMLAASYDNIGVVYRNMEEYSKALWHYEKALEIRQKTLPTIHSDLATSYNNIGNVYNGMGEFQMAHSHYQKAYEIKQKTVPPNHPHLAISCNNIANMYNSMGEYSKALSYYEKAREIFEKTIPVSHFDLAGTYSNIGWVYRNMDDYSKAFSYFQRALNIWQDLLPRNHPRLQTLRETIQSMNEEVPLEILSLIGK